MTRKFAGQQDYAICKLEALWWLDQEQADWSKVPKDQWNWMLMIRTPDFVGRDDLDKAIHVMLDRGKEPQVREVRLESMSDLELLSLRQGCAVLGDLGLLTLGLLLLTSYFLPLPSCLLPSYLLTLLPSYPLTLLPSYRPPPRYSPFAR